MCPSAGGGGRRRHPGRGAAAAPGGLAHGAVRRLGNGSRVSAQDTVPFALWCAARHLRDYQAALWQTVQGGGDTDTTCAMVGGIVAARVGRAGIPQAWLAAREPLPAWVDALA